MLVADIAKGFAAGMAGLAFGASAGGYLAATLAILGHIAPVWSRFRGGKGVATSGGRMPRGVPCLLPDRPRGRGNRSGRGAPRAERAAEVSGVVWTAAALVWWLDDLPNGWGPQPSAGLVGFAAVSTTMILTKFALARRVAR